MSFLTFSMGMFLSCVTSVQELLKNMPTEKIRDEKVGCLAQVKPGPEQFSSIIFALVGTCEASSLISTLETFDDPENGNYLYYTYYCI